MNCSIIPLSLWSSFWAHFRCVPDGLRGVTDTDMYQAGLHFCSDMPAGPVYCKEKGKSAGLPGVVDASVRQAPATRP